MNLAEELWLRGKSAQNSMLHLFSFNSAVMTSVAAQGVKLSVTAPMTFWAAVGRVGGVAPAEPETAKIIDFAPAVPAARATPAKRKADSKPAKPAALAKPEAPAKPVEEATTVKPVTPSKPKAVAKPAAVAKPKAAAKSAAPVEVAVSAAKPAMPANATKPAPAKAAKAEVKPKAKATAKSKPKAKAPKPAPAPEPVVAADAPNPHLLDAPRGGKADDLTVLKGVGGKLAETLNEFGIYHYDQIAGLNDEGIEWLNEQQKGFKMLCARYDLVEQAAARS